MGYSFVVSRTEYTHIFIEADDFYQAQELAEEKVKSNTLKWEIHPETYNYNMLEIDDFPV